MARVKGGRRQDRQHHCCNWSHWKAQESADLRSSGDRNFISTVQTERRDCTGGLLREREIFFIELCLNRRYLFVANRRGVAVAGAE